MTPACNIRHRGRGQPLSHPPPRLDPGGALAAPASGRHCEWLMDRSADAIGFAERVVALLDEGQPDCSACWTW